MNFNIRNLEPHDQNSNALLGLEPNQRLKQLKRLDLERNRISSIEPKSFDSLESLEELVLNRK